MTCNIISEKQKQPNIEISYNLGYPNFLCMQTSETTKILTNYHIYFREKKILTFNITGYLP